MHTANGMNIRHISIWTLVAIAAITTLYLVLRYGPPPQPATEAPAAVTPAAAETAAPAEAAASVAEAGTATTGDTDSTMSSRAPAGRKLLEIYGRISDREQRPIADALIAEERYFQQTRSDHNGNYRLLLDLPRHRYPVLHFLRSGYAGQRLALGQAILGDKTLHELDISLAETLATVRQTGWVGDESGIGLAGARVELSASHSQDRGSFYLTEFTDARGNFEFEGIDAGRTYRLSVSLSPAYPNYEDREFRVTHDPARIDIVLKKLGFADIDGMILNRDSVPVPNYDIYIDNVTTGAHTRKITSDSSGYFRLENFPLGKVSLRTRGREFFKISGLEITESSVQNLEIVIDRGDRHLFGWVVDEGGVGVDKAMVTLKRDFTRDAATHSSYRSQATGRDGAFAFAGLGGGSYRLGVYAQGFEKLERPYRLDQSSDEIFVTLERSPP